MKRSLRGRLTGGLGVAARFLPDLRRETGLLAVVAGVTLSIVAIELLKPWPIQWIVDAALTGETPSDLAPATIVLRGAAAALGLVLLGAALEYAAAIATARAGQGFVRSLRARLFAHLARLSPRFHAAHRTGDLLVRVLGDVSIVRQMLVESSIALATRTLLVVGTLIAMLAVDVRLTLAVVAVVPLFLLTLRLLSVRLADAARRQRRKEGDLANELHESLAGVPTIQSLGATEHVVARFAEGNLRSTRAELRASRISARMSASVELLFGTCAAVALGYGSHRVLAGELSAGELLVFLAYVRSLLKPVRSTSRNSGRFAKAVASGERLAAVLDAPLDVVSGARNHAPPPNPEELRFQDVHFEYPGGAEALRGFDASFRRGELVGLFGESGSGKSTVAALAARLQDPRAGAVLLDGVPLPDHDLGALRAAVALVMQDTVLFGGSVRENLALARPDATDEELWAALREAGAAQFVSALQGGLDAELGTDGAGTSGGEARRLCLARAFLRPAGVWIVDEPFTGLDRAAAGVVLAALRQRARTGIVVVIAHDLDDLSAFDRIVFVRGGRVADQGAHAELAARNEAYRRQSRALARGIP